MIKGVAILLLFQLLGESIVFSTGLPFPGPVVGLVMLFIAMLLLQSFKLKLFVETERAADGFLANLGLLFLPAGVGIIALWGELQSHVTAILIVLIASTALTLIVTVWTFIFIRRVMRGAQS